MNVMSTIYFRIMKPQEYMGVYMGVDFCKVCEPWWKDLDINAQTSHRQYLKWHGKLVLELPMHPQLRCTRTLLEHGVSGGKPYPVRYFIELISFSHDIKSKILC